MGVDGPPPRRETPWDHEPRPRRGDDGAPGPRRGDEGGPARGDDGRSGPPPGLSMRAKVAAAAFVAVLYAGGMGARGDWLPGVVGGILAGIVLVLVLNRIEQRRR